MTADSMDADWAAALKEQKSAEQASSEDGAIEEALNAEDGLVTDQETTPEQNDDVDWSAAFKEQTEAESAVSSEQSSTVRKETASNHLQAMDPLLKIPLEISVQLGNTRMLVNDLLQLGQGSIIELNKTATSEMDLFVNGKLLGRGEVVVTNEHFGIRMTQIVSPEQRIKNLAV